MRTIRSAITSALAVVFALLLLNICLSPAGAAERRLESRDMHPAGCNAKGNIQGLAEMNSGYNLELGEKKPTLLEHLCRFDDLRVYKLKFDTSNEKAAVVGFAKNRDPFYPILVCETGLDRGYMIDLGYFYYKAIKKISELEEKSYGAWARSYAEKRDCRTF